MANEKRLIDKLEAVKLLRGKCVAKYPSTFLMGLLAAATEIEQSPEVDAVEVVHGEWEITEDDYYDLVEMKCSVCGESYGFEDYEDDIPKNYHYCPNCGADMRDGDTKMDGDGNDI